MPTRADHQTGRWTMSFMGWQPLPTGVTTLAEILAGHGMHTAASVDTPYYIRDGMNYDRGFQSFFMNVGQDSLWSLIPEPGYHHEGLDVRAAWRSESDRNAPKTFMSAIQWLERHYKEDFFLYVDTWDPHEPWDAPSYYTELYLPEYDGELVLPLYGNGMTCPGTKRRRCEKGTPPTAVRSRWWIPGWAFCLSRLKTWDWRTRRLLFSPQTTASTSESMAACSAR